MHLQNGQICITQNRHHHDFFQFFLRKINICDKPDTEKFETKANKYLKNVNIYRMIQGE